MSKAKTRETGENMKKNILFFCNQRLTSLRAIIAVCVCYWSGPRLGRRIIPKPDDRRFPSSSSSRQQLPLSQIAILLSFSLSSSSHPFAFSGSWWERGGCAFSSIHVSQTFPPVLFLFALELWPLAKKTLLLPSFSYFISATLAAVSNGQRRGAEPIESPPRRSARDTLSSSSEFEMYRD